MPTTVHMILAQKDMHVFDNATEAHACVNTDNAISLLEPYTSVDEY